MSTYTVKNVKTIHGHDGAGFEATLYKDGKRLGLVVDDGWGGGFMYHFDRAERDALEAYAATLEPCHFHGHVLDYNADMVVGELVEAYELARELKRLSANRTLFYLDTDNPEVDGYRTINVPRNEKVDAHLADKYPGCHVYNRTSATFDTL